MALLDQTDMLAPLIQFILGPQGRKSRSNIYIRTSFDLQSINIALKKKRLETKASKNLMYVPHQ